MSELLKGVKKAYLKNCTTGKCKKMLVTKKLNFEIQKMYRVFKMESLFSMLC